METSTRYDPIMNLEEGCTIHSAYHKELRRLRLEIVKKRTRDVLLLQDNAPAHTSQFAMATTTKCSFEFRLHPLYSPELAPSDFYLLQNLKTNCRYWNFGSNEGIIDAVDENFRDQDEGFYFEGISKLELEKLHRSKWRLYGVYIDT